MRFTVLGANGFVGSHLVARLRQDGHDCWAPERNAPTLFDRDLGHVVFCIGLTADFRTRPFDTVRAHVCVLADILERARFESFLYLSSTRLYLGAENGREEETLKGGDLYNLSKATGESLCLACGRPNVRVARLSNVFGDDFASDNFLPSLIRSATAKKSIWLETTLDSAKDFVSIDDVISVLPKIATQGKYRCYNVASGRNISNLEVIEKIKHAIECRVEVKADAQRVIFPAIDIKRIRDEFAFKPIMILDCIDELTRRFPDANRTLQAIEPDTKYAHKPTMNSEGSTTMTPANQFAEERRERIQSYASNSALTDLAGNWLNLSMREKYVYNFDWLGRPIIQYPQDMVGMQEIIWRTKPDLIIETGIAHGGSLIFSASILALLDMCDAIETGEKIDPRNSRRKVLGIDIDIRKHNRDAIEAHPLSSRIKMIEGSSIADEVIAQTHEFAKGFQRILLCLDSNHTHEHVLAELKAYAPLVTPGSYCVVFDTFVEDMPADLFPDRPWGPGDNPKTALHEYLKTHPEFEIDKTMENKLLITVAPDGYLKRIGQ